MTNDDTTAPGPGEPGSEVDVNGIGAKQGWRRRGVVVSAYRSPIGSAKNRVTIRFELADGRTNDESFRIETGEEIHAIGTDACWAICNVERAPHLAEITQAFDQRRL